MFFCPPAIYPQMLLMWYEAATNRLVDNLKLNNYNYFDNQLISQSFFKKKKYI